MDADEWRLYTLKQLNRTLPFDSDTAIKFVRELGDKQSSCDGVSNSEEVTGRLTGEEARSVYESIINEKNEELVHKPRLRANTKRSINLKKCSVVKTKAEPTTPSLGSLFRYAQEGDLPKLSSALSSGCYDINVTDHFDWTLLMTAATAGHLSIVQYLMDKGALWEEMVDKKRMNAVTLAKLNHHYDIAEYIIQYRPMRFQHSQELIRRDSKDEVGEKFSFNCDICHQPVHGTNPSSHSVSICHQFSCQHKSSALPYTLPQNNKGFQMMIRSGWNPEKGLGSDGQGRKFPVKTVLKRDRLGVGITNSSNAPRVTHFRSRDVSAIKSIRDRKRDKLTSKKPINKKERERLLRKERRWEIGIRQYMSSTDY